MGLYREVCRSDIADSLRKHDSTGTINLVKKNGKNNKLNGKNTTLVRPFFPLLSTQNVKEFYQPSDLEKTNQRQQI